MGIYDREQRPPTSGIGGRLIIGAIIVIMGLFMYWNQTEVNPVTGEKQHVVISPDQEIKLGLEAAQQMAKSQLGQWLIVAVGTAASDPNNPVGANSPAMIAAVVNQMFQLHYSRGDESEADEWGLQLMEQAGFDPRAMIEVMKVLKAASGGSSTFEMFKTHPDPDLRIEQIKAYLAKHPPREGLTEGKKLN